MRILNAILLSLVLLVSPLVAADWPSVDVPMGLRQQNWRGDRRQGSCVHATTVTMLRWHGFNEIADYWRDSYGNGESIRRLAAKSDAFGLHYAYTTSGNVDFLEWASRTRRGAGVSVSPNHWVMLVHIDSKWVCLLDNNRTSKYKWVPRDRFLKDWRRTGGWAFTLMYAPPPPLPERN
jgi:hypothetical protein